MNNRETRLVGLDTFHLSIIMFMFICKVLRMHDAYKHKCATFFNIIVNHVDLTHLVFVPT